MSLLILVIDDEPVSKCCFDSTFAAISARAGVMKCSLADELRQRAAMQQIADCFEKVGMSEYR